MTEQEIENLTPQELEDLRLTEPQIGLLSNAALEKLARAGEALLINRVNQMQREIVALLNANYPKPDARTLTCGAASLKRLASIFDKAARAATPYPEGHDLFMALVCPERLTWPK